MTDPGTERLLSLAKQGDSHARQQLFSRYQDRLRRMVCAYLDPRLAARLDPSDVLQDALIHAAVRFQEYLDGRPIEFYPWLRQFVRQELVTVYRRHVAAERRTIRKEENDALELNDASAQQLAARLTSNDTSPSQRLNRRELTDAVKRAIGQLAEIDQELLFMRWIEQMSIRETAEALQLSESAVKSRFTRILERISLQVPHD
jgi:RNA polymerase sigma-70 factor (ECF subfamily)